MVGSSGSSVGSSVMAEGVKLCTIRTRATIAHSGWHVRRAGTACLKKWYGDAHHCKKWYGVRRTSRTFYAAPGLCVLVHV